MRTLGLIGGLSWESTSLYYQLLNRLARERLGGRHSARLVLVSLDFAPIAAMQSAGLWDEATGLMVDAARRLAAAGAEGLIICANTMHRMAEEVEAAASLPLIHVADATAAAVAAAGARRPLLMATRHTMEQPFYRERLRRLGVEALIPSEPDRRRLDAIIYDELVLGRFKLASKDALLEIAASAVRGEGADAVILGCTELGLILPAEALPVLAFDTAELHARAAMDWALAP